MSAAMTQASASLRSLVAAWLCLTLAGGFFAWAVAADPVELQQAPDSAVRWLQLLVPAAVAAALACAVLRASGRAAWLGRATYGAAPAYLAALKAAGFAAAPWFALALVAAAIYRGRERVPDGAMLLVHAMGSLGGLYFVFSIERYAAGWRPFKAVLQALAVLMLGAAG